MARGLCVGSSGHGGCVARGLAVLGVVDVLGALVVVDVGARAARGVVFTELTLVAVVVDVVVLAVFGVLRGLTVVVLEGEEDVVVVLSKSAKTCAETTRRVMIRP